MFTLPLHQQCFWDTGGQPRHRSGAALKADLETVVILPTSAGGTARPTLLKAQNLLCRKVGELVVLVFIVIIIVVVVLVVFVVAAAAATAAANFFKRPSAI